jgi:hypothetical protein
VSGWLGGCSGVGCPEGSGWTCWASKTETPLKNVIVWPVCYPLVRRSCGTGRKSGPPAAATTARGPTTKGAPGPPRLRRRRRPGGGKARQSRASTVRSVPCASTAKEAQAPKLAPLHPGLRAHRLPVRSRRAARRMPSGAAGAVRPAGVSTDAAGMPGGPAETDRYQSVDKRNEPTPIPLRHTTLDITNAQITTRIHPTHPRRHSRSPGPLPVHPSDTYPLLVLASRSRFSFSLLVLLFSCIFLNNRAFERTQRLAAQPGRLGAHRVRDVDAAMPRHTGQV